MTKVYTKGGDQGETSLTGGARVSKASTQIEAYGNIDELNSSLGYLISISELTSSESKLLEVVQNDLFVIGSLVSADKNKRTSLKLPEIDNTHIENLELAIDIYTEELPKLKNFVLPGGSSASSWAHVCRTICRRVERSIIRHLSESDDEIKYVIEYINRLSDYFFVLGRSLNYRESIKEVLWQPRS